MTEVEGGGGNNQDVIADNAETEDFYEKATALLEIYLEELEPILQNWLATQGKGPLFAQEMALLAELPDGIVADPDINEHLLNQIIPSVKNDKRAFIDKLLVEHFEKEKFRTIVSAISNSNQPTASLSDQEVSTSKRITYGFLTYESAFDFLDGLFDFVDAECGGRAKEKLEEFWQGNELFLSEAVLAYGYCITSEQKCSGKDYWTRFGYGVANALIQEVDVVGMLEGITLLEELIKTSRVQCISSLFEITTVQSAEQFNKIISNCILFGLEPDEIRGIYDKAYVFVQENWDDGYYHGQATVFVVTIVAPTKATKLAKVKLITNIKKVKGFRGLIKIDNLADEFKRFRSKGVGELAKYDNLLKKLEELKIDKQKFFDDFGDGPLLARFDESPELVDAWERTFDIFPANSKFITDIPTLERVSKLASEGSAFRTKLGSNWSEALDDILKNANDLKCSSCGNAGRVGRSSMDQYLDDVDYFVSNFNVGSGGKGETFFNWMRNTTNPTSGQLDELHQTIRDFAKRGIKESEVEGLGKQFPVGTKRYDLRRVGDKYTEYKNKDFVGSPLTAGSDDVDQFINGYLKNVKSMGDLEWKAGFDKLKSAWGSEANALTKMKGQWKSVIESKADEIFEVIIGNQNLKSSLFGTLNETQSRTVFNKLIQDTDDKLFKFIIVD